MYSRYGKDRNKIKGKRKLAFVLAALLIITGIPIYGLSANAEGNTVYLNGIYGNDENSGLQESSPVATFERAKEILTYDGTILITGQLTISGEQIWNLPAAEYGQASISAGVSSIVVSETGNLSLSEIQICSAGETVIENYGVVSLLHDGILYGISNVDVNCVKLYSGSKLITAACEEQPKEQDNVLIISCTDVAYGGTPSPQVVENLSGGNVTFTYKEASAEDSSYSTQAPLEAGSYIVKAVSEATDEYKSAEAFAEYSILSEDMETDQTKESEEQSETVLETQEQTEEPETTEESPAETTADQDIIDNTVQSEAAEKETQLDTDIVTPQETNAEDNLIEQSDTGTKEDAASEIKKEETEKKAETEKSPEMTAAAQAVNKVILLLPSEINSVGAVKKAADATNQYAALSEEEQQSLPQATIDYLANIQQLADTFNKYSNGVRVSGDSLTWNIQLRATLKVNSEDAYRAEIDTLISPYELKLWDVLTDSEYKLAEGETVLITMAAPSLNIYKAIIIVHYKSDGSIEYLSPTISNDLMSFYTSSFSAFDITGITTIVGIGAEEDTEKSEETTKSTEKESTSKATDNSGNQGGSSQTTTPNTGDPWFKAIVTFGILSVAALAVVIILVITKKKKK